MHGFLALGFLLLVSFFALPGQADLLGGMHNTTKDDNDNVEKAKKMVTQYLEENYKEETGYDTKFDYSNWNTKRQVVNGILYKLIWQTTYYFTATDANLEEKPSKTANCVASVWLKTGASELQYGTGGAPQCVDSN